MDFHVRDLVIPKEDFKAYLIVRVDTDGRLLERTRSKELVRGKTYRYLIGKERKTANRNILEKGFEFTTKLIEAKDQFNSLNNSFPGVAYAILVCEVPAGTRMFYKQDRAIGKSPRIKVIKVGVRNDKAKKILTGDITAYGEV